MSNDEMQMPAVILAAGLGTRLGPRTSDLPKCLIEVNGCAILEYQLNALRAASISEINIVVGHRASSIEAFCSRINDLEINLIYNELYSTTNNMFSLLCAAPFVEGRPFLLMNGDVVAHHDLVRQLASDQRVNLIAAQQGIYLEESVKVATSNKMVTALSKDIPPDLSSGICADHYRLDRVASQMLFQECERFIREQNAHSWFELALNTIIQASPLGFDVLDTSSLPWIEIDNAEDLRLAETLFPKLPDLARDKRVWAFDLDGTVYNGSRLIHGAKELLSRVAEEHERIFLTNNSSRSKLDCYQHLERLGIASDVDEFETSIGHFLASDWSRQKRVFVVGTDSLLGELADRGFTFSEEDPELLIVAFDTELTFEKLATATRLISSGIPWIQTHPDNFCPTSLGPVPDAGAIASLLETATGCKPSEIFGKPSKSFLQSIMDSRQIHQDHLILVGDRLHTDILMAQQSSISSLLVLSGEAKWHDLLFSKVLPTGVIPSISSLSEVF